MSGYSSSKVNKAGIAALFFTFLVIIAGSVVRSTGSGMGCPDWPKCYGKIIPPTHESELPENYKEIFLNERLKKNERFARLLKSIGMEKQAELVLSNPYAYDAHNFDTLGTWIEYVNRLFGVLLGFSILLLCYFTFRINLKLFLIAISALIVVIFQGWMGAMVVATNLLQGVITTHMILAYLLIALLILILVLNRLQKQIVIEKNKLISYGLLILSLITLLQVVGGTVVRENVDGMLVQNIERSEILDSIGMKFYIHRTASVLVFVLNILMYWQLKKQGNLKIKNIYLGVNLLIVLEIAVGAILYYFAISPYFQPLHLLLSTLMFGLQFFAFTLYFINFVPSKTVS